MSDLIDRQAAIDAVMNTEPIALRDGDNKIFTVQSTSDVVDAIENLPSAQTEPFVDADKLKRCRFEYINACKIVACPTPDTSKNDIYDAYAVIKALHPIFCDAEF